MDFEYVAFFLINMLLQFLINRKTVSLVINEPKMSKNDEQKPLPKINFIYNLQEYC